MTVGNPLPLFTNAKASLIGVSGAQSTTAQSNPVQPVLAVQPTVDAAQAATAIASSAPTREAITAAFIAAHQNQPEIRPPAAVAAPPARQVAARQLDADELETLLKRARALIEIGDIAPARLLLERAADAQQAGAALLLAQTYDPTVLGTPDMRSITADPAMARDWYQKAARLGSRDAQTRLAQMQN
jgi:TPR repeat protein